MLNRRVDLDGVQGREGGLSRLVALGWYHLDKGSVLMLRKELADPLAEGPTELLFRRSDYCGLHERATALAIGKIPQMYLCIECTLGARLS